MAGGTDVSWKRFQHHGRDFNTRRSSEFRKAAPRHGSRDRPQLSSRSLADTRFLCATRALILWVLDVPSLRHHRSMNHAVLFSATTPTKETVERTGSRAPQHLKRARDQVGGRLEKLWLPRRTRVVSDAPLHGTAGARVRSGPTGSQSLRKYRDHGGIAFGFPEGH
jgi:hypothetical protein